MGIKKKNNLSNNLRTIVQSASFRPLRIAVGVLIGGQVLAIISIFFLFVLHAGYTFAISLTDNSEAAFDIGTYSDTDFANGGVELNATGKTNGTGVYTSNIKDVGVSSAWDTFSFSEDAGPNGEFRMEVGSTTGGSSFSTVSLQQSYVNPIVIPFIVESANTAAVEVRLGSVTSSSFDLKLMIASGATPVNDTVYYMVVEEGAFTMPDGTLIESGSFSTSVVGSTNNGWTSGSLVNFTQSFSSAPALFHHVQTSNDSQWISSWATRQNSQSNPPNTVGFEGSLSGAQAFNSIGSAEDYGWVAIETGTGIVDGIDFETQITSDSVLGHDNGCYTYSFSNSYSSIPITIGDYSEVDGSDGGWLINCSESTTQIGIHAEEDQVLDSERAHTSETANFLAFESSFSYRSVDSTFQVRSCDDVACSGETFVGPDGTGGTVFNTAGSTSISVSDNQYFQYQATLTTDSSSFTSNIDSVTIDYTPSNAPPTVSVNSTIQKTDGSGMVDIEIEVDDAEDEDVILKVEYETDSDGSCNGPWANATLDESVGATADFDDSGGSPSVVNSDTYQIGSTVTRSIITTSGVNTIAFDWDTVSDLPVANGTQCLRFTGNDGLTDTSPGITQTVTVDNIDPIVSSTTVSPSSGSVENGDIVTVTLSAGETGLNYDSCTINTKAVGVNFSDNGDGTYELLYVPISGHNSWSSGDLSINCILEDASGNTGSTTAFTDSNTLAGVLTVESGSGGGSCPSISNTNFDINEGDTVTASREVELNISASNATLIIFSESNLFTGAAFTPIASPQSFTLSEGEGNKTIYGQFKSDCATGSIFSTAIVYEIPEEGSIASKILAEEEAAAKVNEDTSHDDEIESVQENDDTESVDVDDKNSLDSDVDMPSGDGGVGGPEQFTPPADGIDESIGSFTVVESIVEGEPEIDTFETSLTNLQDDFYNGAILSFFTGPLAGESRTILDYDGETQRITLQNGFEFAPQEGDRFSIIKQELQVEIPSTEEIIRRLEEEGFEVGFSEEEQDDIFERIKAVQAGVEDIYLDVIINDLPIESSSLAQSAVREGLESESDRLAGILDDVELTNINASTLDDLLEISDADIASQRAIQSKTSTLQAVNGLARRILETNGRQPIIESYMNWGSVQMNFLAANPLPIPIEVAFETYLPKEVSSEHFLELSGLSVSYDSDVGSFVVREELTLDPNEVLVRSVELEDVWIISEENLSRYEMQSAALLVSIENSSFHSQGILIDGGVQVGVSLIRAEQEKTVNSPQQHILAYRKNLQRLRVLEEDMNFFESLVTITAETRLEELRIKNLRLILAVVLSGIVFLLLVIVIVWKFHKEKTLKKHPGKSRKK